MGYVKTVETVPVDYSAARAVYAAALRPIVIEFLENWQDGVYFALRDKDGDIVLTGEYPNEKMVPDPAKYAALNSDEEVISLYIAIRNGDNDIFQGLQYESGFESSVLMPFLNETTPIDNKYEREKAAAINGPMEELRKARNEREDKWDKGLWERKRKQIEEAIKEIDNNIAELDRKIARIRKQMEDASAVEKPRLERDIANLEIKRMQWERDRQELVNELAELGRAEEDYNRTEPEVSYPGGYEAAVEELRKLEEDAKAIKVFEGESSEAYEKAMEKVEKQKKVVEDLWEAYEAELAKVADAKRAVVEAEQKLVDDIQKRVDAAVKQFSEDMKRWKAEQDAALSEADKQRAAEKAIEEEKEIKRRAVELSYEMFELAMKLQFSTVQSEIVKVGNVYQATETDSYENVKALADKTAQLLNDLQSKGLEEAKRLKADYDKIVGDVKAIQAAASAARELAEAKNKSGNEEEKYYLI